MATSGSIDFTRSRNEIIKDAYQLINAYDPDEDISNQDLDFGNVRLNSMIKHFQTQGFHLWTMEEASLIISAGTNKYTLSSDSSSARATPDSDLIITTLTSATATSAVSLAVESTTGLTISDYIGVVLDDDTIHWTTIATIPTSTSLTINSGLASAASENARIYTFTSRITRPLRISSIRSVQGTDTDISELSLMPMSRDEYFAIPNKNAPGRATAYYYDPKLSGGKLYLWPTPDDPNVYYNITYDRSLEDFDSGSNTPDLPQEWIDALTYNLAVRMWGPFPKDDAAFALVSGQAAQFLKEAMDFDVSNTSIKLVPERRGH